MTELINIKLLVFQIENPFIATCKVPLNIVNDLSNAVKYQTWYTSMPHFIITSEHSLLRGVEHCKTIYPIRENLFLLNNIHWHSKNKELNCLLEEYYSYGNIVC